MTEERMIRFTEAQFNEFNTFVELDAPDWETLEPAPPKDWRPYCFNKRCCKKENLGILSDMGPCKSCPYRDLE